MSVWYWVRHAPTKAKAFAGWKDVPADFSGIDERIDRLDAFLPRDATLVASDLDRASATADLLSKGRHRLPDKPALREFNFGDWEGLTAAEIATAYPELSRAYWEEPGEAAPPNGESWYKAARRIQESVDWLAMHNPDAAIIVVAHMGVILTQIRRARMVSPREVISMPVDHLSVTKIRFEQTTWQLELLNYSA
ncbi:MAG: histidine phosphatase family protein [Aestuariivita sp.]|nr:histidine phosphatase family protein [Aestuariivita sp.]MCY4346586.1 histidine phosphatase family protein [Aestuariivita sp.]